MSENKNGQGAQWSKGAVAATAAAAAVAAAHKQQHQQQQQSLHHTTPIYNAAALSLTSPAAGNASALYGGTGHLGAHQTSTDVSTYAAARFQAPPIDHRSASSSSSHIVPPNPTPSSTTNVPVPSGFIPPPFPPAAAAATSVLTPNPYAVASLTAPAASHTSANHPHSHAHSQHPSTNQQFSGPHPMPSSHHAHFGMDQFQHLNVQQQYELSKLMAASFNTSQQTVGSSGPTNLSSNSSSAPSTSGNVPPGGSAVSQIPTTGRQATQPPIASTESSTSGSINPQVADQVISAISTGSSASKLATTPIHGRLMGLGVHAPDEEKLRRIQQVVESGIGCVFKHNIIKTTNYIIKILFVLIFVL